MADKNQNKEWAVSILGKLVDELPEDELVDRLVEFEQALADLHAACSVTRSPGHVQMRSGGELHATLTVEALNRGWASKFARDRAKQAADQVGLYLCVVGTYAVPEAPLADALADAGIDAVDA